MNSPRIQSLINRSLYAWRRVPPKPMSVCRLLYDHECAIPRGDGQFPFLWRFFGARMGYPNTVALRGGRGDVELAEWWQEFFYQENTGKAVAYTKGHGSRPNTGWVNTQPWPRVKQIACSGDGVHHTYLVVTEIQGSRAYIQSYDNSKRPQDYPTKDFPTVLNFLNPFGVGFPDGSVGGADCGLCYTFAIHNPGERLYVDVADLTFLRSL